MGLLDDFIHGSQIGGGKASGAIARNAKAFGDNTGQSGTVDPNSLAGVISKAFDQGQGDQKDGDFGLLLKSLGQNNQLAGPAGDSYIDPDTGLEVAQPGALTTQRQYRLTGTGVEDGKYSLGDNPSQALTQADVNGVLGRSKGMDPLMKIQLMYGGLK